MVIITDLASRPVFETLSTDKPSPRELRPFGLTLGVSLSAGEAMLSLAGLTYDPALQVNVDDEGQPVVDKPFTPQMATTTDTQYDMQWFVDKD